MKRIKYEEIREEHKYYLVIRRHRHDTFGVDKVSYWCSIYDEYIQKYRMQAFNKDTLYDGFIYSSNVICVKRFVELNIYEDMKIYEFNTYKELFNYFIQEYGKYKEN